MNQVIRFSEIAVINSVKFVINPFLPVLLLVVDNQGTVDRIRDCIYGYTFFKVNNKTGKRTTTTTKKTFGPCTCLIKQRNTNIKNIIPKSPLGWETLIFSFSLGHSNHI